MVVFFEIALGQRCVLSVIPGRPSEGEIEGRRRLRTNGPLVIGFRSGNPAMIGLMATHLDKAIAKLEDYFR